MKQLIDVINEDAIVYQLSDDHEEKTVKLLKDFTEQLPVFPNIVDPHSSASGRSNHTPGAFWFNAYDVLRSHVESSKYIGNAIEIELKINTKTNDVDVELIKNTFRDIFKINVNEGLFDDNVTKELPTEYKWVSNLYDSLSKYFKTKNFSHVESNNFFIWGYKANEYNKYIKNDPTIKKDGLLLTLCKIDLNEFKPNYEYSHITLGVFVSEEKDPQKVAELKALNDARKPKDCIDRDLMEGDTVAYVMTGGFNSFQGLATGKITKISKEYVEIEGASKKVSGYKCCLISRKNGKMIN